MEKPQRDRVCIDLRCLRAQLRTHAILRQLTPPPSCTMPSSSTLPPSPPKCRSVRPPDLVAREAARQGHAALMNFQVLRADVSKIICVAALIEGAAPSKNHAQTVAALQASTDKLAVIATDPSAFLRIIHRGQPGGTQALERYRACVMTLNDDIRRHLAVAAQLVA